MEDFEKLLKEDDEIEQAIAETNSGVPEERFRRTLADIPPLIPEEDDQTILFRNNWLAQGQVAMLTSSSGVGKSSMAIQAVFHWSAGVEYLAQPMRPLKCAIIQAEDSVRDIAEQIEGMTWGLSLQGWTQEQIEAAKKSILIPDFTGLMGDDFISTLREFQADTKCDLLVVNPIQAYFGDDVSDQKAVSQWARGGIDPILKSSSAPCAAFLVQHTTKITSSKRDERPDVEDYGEYIGAGSHEWTDWARAKFSFLKVGTSGKYFKIAASKRGNKLKNWLDADGNYTRVKYMKHSDGHIFWQFVSDPDEIAEAEGKAPETPKTDPSDIAWRIAEDLKATGAARLFELCDRYSSFARRSVVRQAVEIIKAKPEQFRLQCRTVMIGRNNVRYVGLADAIRERANQDMQQWEIDQRRIMEESLND